MLNALSDNDYLEITLKTNWGDVRYGIDKHFKRGSEPDSTTPSNTAASAQLCPPSQPENNEFRLGSEPLIWDN